jgi:hypothetical protein
MLPATRIFTQSGVDIVLPIPRKPPDPGTHLSPFKTEESMPLWSLPNLSSASSPTMDSSTEENPVIATLRPSDCSTAVTLLSPGCFINNVMTLVEEEGVMVAAPNQESNADAEIRLLTDRDTPFGCPDPAVFSRELSRPSSKEASQVKSASTKHSKLVSSTSPSSGTTASALCQFKLVARFATTSTGIRGRAVLPEAVPIAHTTVSRSRDFSSSLPSGLTQEPALVEYLSRLASPLWHPGLFVGLDF